VARQVVRCELVRLAHLAAAVALEVDGLELLVHGVVRFELPHLERHVVAVGIADGAEEDLRILDIALALQQPVELRQLGMRHRGCVDVAARDVQDHSDRRGIRMVGADHGLADVLPGVRSVLVGPLGVDQLVRARGTRSGLDSHRVIEGRNAGCLLGGHMRLVIVNAISSSAHDYFLSGLASYFKLAF
jgi:hypothetical protein